MINTTILLLFVKKYKFLVSMGGSTGLFVGASLLSFIEIIYYFIIRPYGTMYMERQQNKL